jgi:hypothetical protein
MNDSKYTRSNFYLKVTVDNNLENDLVSNYWYLFQLKRSYSFVTITHDFIQRPDLLSFALYGTDNLWWILCKVNNIDDIWNDLIIGQIIIVPDINDINDWILAVYTQQNK